MIEWLTEQLRLFDEWHDTVWGWDRRGSSREFIDYLERTGASPPVLCPSCNTYEANVCGACQAQIDRDAGWDDEPSPWVRVEYEQRPKDGQFIALLFDEGDGSRSAQGWSYSAGDMIAWPVCGATHWMLLPLLPEEPAAKEANGHD